MKILVAYKRVVDYNVRIQVKPDGSGVVTEGVKLSPNPFDEIALEEALRLRDKGIATEVVVATIAPADAQAHLRNGLAMGANRAIHVVTDQPVQPLAAARTLLGPDAILGASCYDSLQLARDAVANGASYVAFGAFFPTTTKLVTRRATPDLLRDAAALGVPRVAIGGITPGNGRALVEAGADLLAVIGGVFDAPDPVAAVHAYRRCFD